MICSARSFSPRGIGCLQWFAPLPGLLWKRCRLREAGQVPRMSSSGIVLPGATCGPRCSASLLGRDCRRGHGCSTICGPAARRIPCGRATRSMLCARGSAIRRDAATFGHAVDGHAAGEDAIGDCCDSSDKPRSPDTSRTAWGQLMARVGMRSCVAPSNGGPFTPIGRKSAIVGSWRGQVCRGPCVASVTLQQPTITSDERTSIRPTLPEPCLCTLPSPHASWASPAC